MSFEKLANELLFDLFEYLSCADLFHAFNGLNSRFDYLMIEYIRHNKYFDFQWMFKEDLNIIRRRYLQFFINDIKSIRLSDDDTTPHEIDLFLTRLYPLYRFQNLQSISLSNIYSIDKVNRILYDLKNISTLTDLNLKQCFIHYDPKNILIMMNSIWSLPNLTSCVLDIYFDNVSHLIPPEYISCSLQHLSISGFQCNLDNLSLLYDHTPFLEYLSLNIWDPYDDHYQLSLIDSLKTLKLKCESSLRVIRTLLQKTPNLINLTVETKTIQVDGNVWKDIITKYLTQLKTFNLKMEFQLVGYDDREQELNQIIESYRNDFWIDQHNWFIQCFCCTENEITTIHLHTLPYCFQDFSINSNENIVFKTTFNEDDRYLKYNYVENLNYCCSALEDIIFPNFQFYNLQYLTITFPYNDNFRCIVPQFNSLKYLEVNLTHWSHCDNNLQQLQIILDQAPNLYYLKFHSWLAVPSKFENKNKKTSNQTVWKMPPFSCQSSSVRCLDLLGVNQSDQNHYYNDQQCSALIRSSLINQCEFLCIEVEKRTNIIDLVSKMNHLRSLKVRCRDRKKNDDLIKWLQTRLPSTCSFAKDSKFPNDIRLWIR